MGKNKISFKVEIDDFWIDEDSGNIQDELVRYIRREVVNEIWSKVEKKVEEQIERVVKQEVEKSFTRKISSHIDKIIKSGEPVLKGQTGYDDKGNHFKKDMTIQEYIERKFIKDSGWGSPSATIEKLAKTFAEEMKKRYDILFASQIVNKMNEQGLLKDEAITKLLDK